ncbi:bone morphogenetic protein receptor type-2-like protein [Euroglyphus maynei]|uniref:receptor protein serine/threonine kinase n=1 Tax=Euroglyphus maynei TaxID=6958 RepID=A0A1Y3B3S6_EURMA|nr:bone morphogenetic protein receptor type-2-like protein [Euroglyphus maynei]
MNKQQQKPTNDSLHLLESSKSYQNQNSHNNNNNQSSLQKISKDVLPENLNFIEIIGNGKYGTIWKGKFNDMTVVIKMCSNSNREHLWTNESQIYSLPLMNHSNLSNFFQNINRINDNGQIEHCLVIEYGHYGSLQTYLAEHTFDWTRMCQLFKSLVQGLAYLHTEIHDNGKIKPSIAHCDLCSANVVVKADGTCMICDFQFAVHFLPNSNHRPLITIDHELRSGLARYLAPEILDDSINLRPTESLFKQADVYALGLILWEIASRCTDLYQGIDVPAFKLPYEHEVGLTPTLDQMRLLVNKHKARPLFPDIWKDSNFAIRLLKETISECWDHEPEARLTSLCIDERINELPALWKRHKMETLSSCYVIAALLQEHSNNKVLTESDKENQHCNLISKTLENSNNQSLIMPNEYANVCYINKFENSLHDKFNNHHHLLHHPHHKHYFHHHHQQQRSLNNGKRLHHPFVEKNFKINSLNQSSNKLTLPLQPYHARNPCLERNLLINEIDEHDDEILEQGLKFKNPASHQSDINFDTIIDMNLDSNEISHHNDSMENRSLIRSSTTPSMPIPFIQNYVNSTEAGDFSQPEIM